MKAQVIGSGSMWTKYNSTCYLIDDKTMIDFPNGACKYLYRIDIVPNTINNIILTHFHGDHYFDIPFYLLNKSRSENKDVNIFCAKEGKSKINKFGNLAFPNSFKEVCNSLNLKYNFNDNFVVDNYKVKRLLLEHGKMKRAFGYIFSKDDICVGFTGDTSLCENVENLSRKCNYLFCDCMFVNGNSRHQGIDNLEYLSKKYPKCIFVVTHLEDETRQKLEKMKIKNVIVPDDGQIIVVK